MSRWVVIFGAKIFKDFNLYANCTSLWWANHFDVHIKKCRKIVFTQHPRIIDGNKDAVEIL